LSFARILLAFWRIVRLSYTRHNEFVTRVAAK